MADKKTNFYPFKRFLKENRTLAISIPILIVLIIAVLIIYSGMGGENVKNVVPALMENAPADMSGNQIEVLPQTERDTGADTTTESGEEEKSDGEVKDPFAGPVTLTGIVVSDGDGMAILEVGGKAVIARENDVLSSGLTVSSISIDKVILKNNDKEIELNLN